MIYKGNNMENNVENIKTSIDEKEEEYDPNTIAYYHPPFWKRVFAIILDGLICSFFALSVFIGVKAITDSNEYYQSQLRELDQYKLDSNLYLKSESLERITDIVTYYNTDDTSSSLQVKNALSSAIDNFFTFYLNTNGQGDYNIALDHYNTSRLDYINEGRNLFIKDESGVVIDNKGVTIASSKYVDYYKNEIDTYFLGVFSAKIEKVLVIEKYFSYILLFMEIPIAVTIGALITYYIIPLCLFRGKKTIGRLLFKIGLVDKNVLSVKASRFTARFLIVYFLLIVLSVFAVGVPLIISFTMMLVTKKKQTFQDYLLGIEEVDTSEQKVYMNKDEIYNNSSVYDTNKFRLK